jgi:hypothetical protein
MISIFPISVTVAGSAGSATGSTTSERPLNGRVLAVHIDYTSQPATADVTIISTQPTQSILTISNANTDAWFYPRVEMDTLTGTAATGVYDAIPVAAYINVAVAGGDPGSVVVTLLVEC